MSLILCLNIQGTQCSTNLPLNLRVFSGKSKIKNFLFQKSLCINIYKAILATIAMYTEITVSISPFIKIYCTIIYTAITYIAI